MADTPLLDQHWNNASDRLNRYVSEEGGGTIDWERARAIFNKLAMSGQGNFGDWVNGVMAQRAAWVNVPAAETPASSTAATGPKGPRYQGGGINDTKWNDPNHKTLKYTVLRIADEVPPAQLRAQFEAGTGAQYDRIKALGFAMDRDGKISRADLGPLPIDIIHGDNREYGWRDENALKAKPDTTTPPTTTTTTAQPARVAMGLSNPALLSTVADRWDAETPMLRPRADAAIQLPQQQRPAMTLQSVMPTPAAWPTPMLTPLETLTAWRPPPRPRQAQTLGDFLMRSR